MDGRVERGITFEDESEVCMTDIIRLPDDQGDQRPLRVISLGWGVQSFTIAAMAALGEIEPVDYAVFADTLYESVLSYEYMMDGWSWLEDRGVKARVVRNKENPITINRGGGKIYIPAFTESKNASGGMLRRQCTQRWKVAPIRRFIQSQRNGQPVEMLLGISTDEWQRMRDSDVKYITNSYPLIDKKMSRLDCMRWLEEHGIQIPPKSACYFCPFHTTKEWNRIKQTSDWEKVVEVDNMIRNARPSALGLRLYLHASRKPIDEVDFRSAEEKGQMTLWDNECSGMCGV